MCVNGGEGICRPRSHRTQKARRKWCVSPLFTQHSSNIGGFACRFAANCLLPSTWMEHDSRCWPFLNRVSGVRMDVPCTFCWCSLGNLISRPICEPLSQHGFNFIRRPEKIPTPVMAESDSHLSPCFSVMRLPRKTKMKEFSEEQKVPKHHKVPDHVESISTSQSRPVTCFLVWHDSHNVQEFLFCCSAGVWRSRSWVMRACRCRWMGRRGCSARASSVSTTKTELRC